MIELIQKRLVEYKVSGPIEEENALKEIVQEIMLFAFAENKIVIRRHRLDLTMFIADDAPGLQKVEEQVPVQAPTAAASQRACRELRTAVPLSTPGACRPPHSRSPPPSTPRRSH